MITVCIIRCLKVDGNPEIVVASFSNPISDTAAKNTGTANANKCLELFCTNSTLIDQPILIAGGFNAELDKLKSNGFIVPQYDPTLPRMLKLAHKRKANSDEIKQIRTDYFAYRPSTNTTITLEDVHAESVVPCPGLVTGSHNIDYDKGIATLPKVIGDHDPVRAKLIITKTPQASHTPGPQQPSLKSLDETPGKLPKTKSSASRFLEKNFKLS